MPTDSDFLAATAVNPADRLPRLVYADWLDERDDPRGEYLRLDDALDHHPPRGEAYSALFARRAALEATFDPAWVTAVRGSPTAGTAAEFAFARGRALHQSGPSRSLSKAARLYRTAADLGHPPALLHLGHCFRFGWGVNLDSGRAEELYRRAAKAGHAPALFHLGCLYLGPGFQPANGVGWFERGVGQNCGECAVALAQLYACGVGVGEDLARSERFYRRAADLGHPAGRDGLRWLADRHARRAKTPAVVRLFAREPAYQPAAIEWEWRAFDLCGWDGLHDIGVAYYHGEGVREDAPTAVRYVWAAAQNGCVPAFVTLGRMYANGRGVAPDGRAAERWLSRAAEAGDADAHYYLGWLFDTGRVVKKDRRRAVEWYRKAAALGDDGAKGKLAELGC